MNQYYDYNNDRGKRKPSRPGWLRRRLTSTTVAIYVLAAAVLGNGYLHSPPPHSPHSPGSDTPARQTSPAPDDESKRVAPSNGAGGGGEEKKVEKTAPSGQERALVLGSLLKSIKQCEARGDEATAVTLDTVLDVLDSITKFIECTPRERELAKALEVSFAQIEDTFKLAGSPTVYQSRILTASREGQVICSRICDEPPDRRGE